MQAFLGNSLCYFLFEFQPIITLEGSISYTLQREGENKVKRRLSAQFMDTSASTGIKTRETGVCVGARALASILMIYRVNSSKGLPPVPMARRKHWHSWQRLSRDSPGVWREREREREGLAVLHSSISSHKIQYADRAIQFVMHSGSAVTPVAPAIISGCQHSQADPLGCCLSWFCRFLQVTVKTVKEVHVLCFRGWTEWFNRTILIHSLTIACYARVKHF